MLKVAFMYPFACTVIAVSVPSSYCLNFEVSNQRRGNLCVPLTCIVSLKTLDKHASLNHPQLMLSETPCRVVWFAVQFATEDTLHNHFKTHHNIYI